MRQLKITKQVTNRDTPSLDKYLQEIGRVELISPEEEVSLARNIKSGDTAALRKLVNANLKKSAVPIDRAADEYLNSKPELRKKSKVKYENILAQLKN